MEITESMSYTPQEAWDELKARSFEYFDIYNAAYSGKHLDLASTAEFGSFWKRKGKVKLHVPAAADIANTAANLLFGEEPRFTIYDSVKGKTEDESQPRLSEIITENMLIQKLHESAELGSASGDVFLKCKYDKDNATMPIIDIVKAQDALPEYRLSKLECIHFFTILHYDRNTRTYWRVYEKYEHGKITTKVFKGDASNLGSEDSDALQMLGIEEETLTPVQMLLASHVFNVRPSRVWRTNDKGRSDFEGLRDMLDSLDEVYTSWMRDIRLAKSRLIVPAEYLRRNKDDMFPDGQYTYDFDEDVETLVALDIMNDANMTITPSQFAIRSAEHATTFDTTLKTIVSMAGYSPQTFGLDIQGNAQSGTSRKILERKSLETNKKKQAYWVNPLQKFMTAVMQLDKALYGNDKLHDSDMVRVEMHDPDINDPTEVSSTVNMLRSAQAASTEVLVKMQHNDWTQEQVDEEVQKINEQYGIESIVPDLISGEGENP